MLRFIIINSPKYSRTEHISIHPMLRFILIRNDVRTLHMNISIHPMLRFIQNRMMHPSMLKAFQYIPCYGLSSQVFRVPPQNLYFNTSHVTVYQTNYKGNSIVDGYFNTSHVTVYQ